MRSAGDWKRRPLAEAVLAGASIGAAVRRGQAALAAARENGRRLGVAVEFGRADLLDAGRYDGVLANLPYVAEGAELDPEISRYEPASALFAGPDGLDVIRRLLVVVAERGRPLP